MRSMTAEERRARKRVQALAKGSRAEVARLRSALRKLAMDKVIVTDWGDSTFQKLGRNCYDPVGEFFRVPVTYGHGPRFHPDRRVIVHVPAGLTQRQMKDLITVRGKFLACS